MSVLRAVSYATLPGWHDTNIDLSLAAFRRSADEILNLGRAFTRDVAFGGSREDWRSACEAAKTAISARAFFETHFTPLAVTDPERPEGLFTGYFEPEAPGSRTAGPDYPVAIYRKPAELVSFDDAQSAATGLKYGLVKDGKPMGFLTRKEIEQGALTGRGLEIVWLKDWADAFFIHIQGSGRIRLPDGSLMRLAYGGKNGQPYTGIGPVLVERGVFSRAEMSMQSTRAWMVQNPQAARELMWENRSFIFFREVPIDNPALGPPGAQMVSLTPQRSLAVDRRFWAFGTPIWLETQSPSGAAGAMQPFRALMIAQDTGTAIRGHVRGDVFWGAGSHAAMTAGHMKSPGTITVLLPNALATRLLA